MDSEEFQKLHTGQIFIRKTGYGKHDRIIILVADVDYQYEVCSLVVCVLSAGRIHSTWKPTNVFVKTHQNKSRYACEKWFEPERWDVPSSKLELLLESGRTAESFMKEGIHTLVRSHSESLHNLRVRTKMEKRELYKGIRALK